MNVDITEALAGVTTSRDIVELHILEYVDRIRHQHERLKRYVQKSGTWAELKEIDKWKPYDFLHYFENLFQKRYRKQYGGNKNVVRMYQRIEVFMEVNKISNEEYKEFIDLAFARHFNDNNSPTIGNICSSSLYNHLMVRETKRTQNSDWFTLDQTIKRESDDFYKHIEQDADNDLDEVMAREARAFE